jgi:hypothetical protein
MSSASAMSLVGDALELRHRLPRLWARGDGRPAAGLEGDHIVAFVAPDDGGPPGQTAPHLLGSPCRRHHRYKTHGGWTYSMPEPGLYLWRSPLGRRYLVDWTGTTNLDLPA